MLNTMDKTSSTSHIAPKSIQKQFFQWAVKWFYANQRENNSTKPDIPSVICLLQAIGFKLREFENQDRLISFDNKIKNENIRVTMECGTSKMIAILEMDDVKCECPNTNETKDGSFWSITGTGPMGSMGNVNKIEETGSNLLPEMSKEVTTIVRDVTYKLLQIINNKADINQNTDCDMNLPTLGQNNVIEKNNKIKEGLVRSYTDYFSQNYKPLTTLNCNSNLSSTKINSTISIKNSINSVKEKPILKREGTYEVNEEESIDEPRPSPPKLTSSPILHQLCSSLSQISLQSEEEIFGLADYVVKAHQILDKAVNFIIKKLPVNSSHSSIHDEINFVKPAAPSLTNSSFSKGSPQSVGSNRVFSRSSSSASLSRPDSACSMPARTTRSSFAISSLKKPAARRSGPNTTTSNNLPPMRDRSSSFSVIQRKTQPSPYKTAGEAVKTTVFAATPMTATATAKRKSISGIANPATPAQRTTSVISKVPSNKLAQSKPNNYLTTERNVLTAKRRTSPDAKNMNNSLAAQRNVSLIKPPSRLSVGIAGTSSSKFGFTNTKK